MHSQQPLFTPAAVYYRGGILCNCAGYFFLYKVYFLVFSPTKSMYLSITRTNSSQEGNLLCPPAPIGTTSKKIHVPLSLYIARVYMPPPSRVGMAAGAHPIGFVKTFNGGRRLSGGMTSEEIWTFVLVLYASKPSLHLRGQRIRKRLDDPDGTCWTKKGPKSESHENFLTLLMHLSCPSSSSWAHMNLCPRVVRRYPIKFERR